MTTEQKIDKILMILEGTEHQAGLLQRVEETEKILRGSDGSMGIVHKTNIMWRVNIWIVGGVGTLFGFVLNAAARRYL